MVQDKEIQKDKWEKIVCDLLDIEYNEDLGPKTNPYYKGAIVMTLKDRSSGRVLMCQLSAKDAKSLYKLNVVPSSKDMIDIMEKIKREAESGVQFCVPKNHKGTNITTDILKANNEEFDDKLETDPIDLTNPVAGKRVNKSILKQKNREDV